MILHTYAYLIALKAAAVSAFCFPELIKLARGVHVAKPQNAICVFDSAGLGWFSTEFRYETIDTVASRLPARPRTCWFVIL